MTLPDPETCRKLARDVAPRWIWMPGMLARRGLRVFLAGPDGLWLEDSDRNDPGLTPIKPDDLPDLTDPLTAAGAELVLVKVWGDVQVDVIRYEGAWAVTRPPIKGARGLAGMLDAILATGATKLEATIAAILAAPEKS